MPELPEVEITRQGVEPWIKGKIIKRVEVRNARLRWPVDKEIIALRNGFVLSVQRRAKYLLLELDKGWIIIHFGMSGCLQVLPQPQPPKKHDHIDLIIDSGCTIRYSDPRRLGSWIWSNNLFTSPMLSHLGPEPFSNEFNGHWLYKKSFNKRILIKPWLMNAKLVVGVGNIYANESLFVAGILPGRAANSLSKNDYTLLAQSIKKVLLHSIEHGGTTLRNFLQIDGKPGTFMQKLQVYKRVGKPCLTCNTPIQIDNHYQRSTFFCPQCQR